MDVDGIDSPDEDGGEDGGGLSETEVTGLGMLISSIDSYTGKTFSWSRKK